jgi:hypothetical protein
VGNVGPLFAGRARCSRLLAIRDGVQLITIHHFSCALNGICSPAAHGTLLEFGSYRLFLATYDIVLKMVGGLITSDALGIQ